MLSLFLPQDFNFALANQVKLLPCIFLSLSLSVVGYAANFKPGLDATTSN
jgi:hypothetical protein